MPSFKFSVHGKHNLICQAILFLALLLTHSTLYAQSSWMDVGKDLLNKTTEPAAATTSLSESDISAGLKEALRVGSEKVVDQLGKTDGFNADPAIHIPLPDQMKTVRNTLEPLGMAGMMDDLELKLNRAAEQATPPARELFWDAIEKMTLDDVTGIYNGPDDAATRYFESKMSDPLSKAMQPIIDQSLADVGAIQAYDAVMGEYQALPFVPNVKADLNSYVTEKGMDGIFHYLAEQEAGIRQNPLERTTDILQKVFGAK